MRGNCKGTRITFLYIVRGGSQAARSKRKWDAALARMWGDVSECIRHNAPQKCICIKSPLNVNTFILEERKIKVHINACFLHSDSILFTGCNKCRNFFRRWHKLTVGGVSKWILTNMLQSKQAPRQRSVCRKTAVCVTARSQWSPPSSCVLIITTIHGVRMFLACCLVAF